MEEQIMSMALQYSFLCSNAPPEDVFETWNLSAKEDTSPTFNLQMAFSMVELPCWRLKK
jgi:hypothetical protein